MTNDMKGKIFQAAQAVEAEGGNYKYATMWSPDIYNHLVKNLAGADMNALATANEAFWRAMVRRFVNVARRKDLHAAYAAVVKTSETQAAFERKNRASL